MGVITSGGALWSYPSSIGGRGGSQHERGAGGVAKHKGRFRARRDRDRGKVLILPLGRERLGVAAVPPPAAIVSDHGETLPQFRRRDEGMPRAERAHTDNQR